MAWSLTPLCPLFIVMKIVYKLTISAGFNSIETVHVHSKKLVYETENVSRNVKRQKHTHIAIYVHTFIFRLVLFHR